jgi:hypothetical protein
MFMSGPMMLRMRASRMLASWKRSLMAAKVRISRASAPYAFTTWMPERFSCVLLERSASPSWTRSVRSMSSALVRFTA